MKARITNGPNGLVLHVAATEQSDMVLLEMFDAIGDVVKFAGGSTLGREGEVVERRISFGVRRVTAPDRPDVQVEVMPSGDAACVECRRFARLGSNGLCGPCSRKHDAALQRAELVGATDAL